MAEKVDFAYKHFEQPIPIDAVLRKDEMIDTIAITRGRGTEGVVTRWGVTRLPRKTHRGLRKVSPLANHLAHIAHAKPAKSHVQSLQHFWSVLPGSQQTSCMCM